MAELTTVDLIVCHAIDFDHKVCCTVPSFGASVGDLVMMDNKKIYQVVYRFYNPDDDLMAAICDAYKSATPLKVFSKSWEA